MFPSLRLIRVRRFVFILGLFATASSVSVAEWKDVKVPDVWKNPPAGVGGYGWYRCAVTVPQSWKGKQLEIFVEPIDDAREIFVNGESIAFEGSFPPQFRSGLGSRDRHTIAANHIRFGAANTVAIRVYNSDGRGGFNVAAPVLFADDEAIRLEGTWHYQPGDDRQWGQWEPAEPPQTVVFAKTVSRSDAERILRQLPGDEGPLPVSESLKKFKVLDGLAVDVALSEPQIGQPLFMSFDERGRLWVMNYLQYPNPAGLTMVSRDKYLRTVYDKVPPPPPNHFRGADKITIHEDTDADGRFDQHKSFVEGLNLATSFAHGRGGVWVLNPPYLLFYPDRNQDDVPDGDPEVHLQGFGIEDSHSVTNNLRLGPDGWLYAAQGSTVTGDVRRYGSTDKPIHSLGQLIWRYHPEQKRYEIFAEGGGNAFGVEIDSKGRIYSGHNGGDTRGFHYVQGGYLQKGFGKHGELSNPYAFGYFPHMQHHNVPRFTHTFVIYEGAALSAQFAGKLFGVGPLQSHVVLSDVQPNGATFKTRDIGHALTSGDPWFRPVAIAPGPDGALYVADMYEQRIDHASHYQGRVDKTSGRIYRLRAPEAKPSPRFDYAKLSSDKLIDGLGNENRWHREIILRLLGDRRDQSVIARLEKLVNDSTDQLALEAFWALNLTGGFDETVANRTLQHTDPYVRQWTVRLLCDDNEVSPAMAAQLAELAVKEPNVEVRCQLASSARRINGEQCLAIVKGLVGHDEDAADPYAPLLNWWAIEAKAGTNRESILAMFADTKLWSKPLVEQHILERLMRRYAQAGSQKDLMACAKLLELAPGKGQIAALMKGFEAAYAGRELSGLPPELTAVMAKVGGGSLALRLRRADADAVADVLKLVADEKAKTAERVRYLQILGQINQPNSVPVLLQIASNSKDDEVRSSAIAALQAYEDTEIPDQLLGQWQKSPAKVREVLLSVLTSRKAWSMKMMAAVQRGDIARESVPAAIVQKMLFHRDAQLIEQVKQLWGEVKDASNDEMRSQVEQFAEVIATGSGNPYKGQKLFAENCGKCHLLFSSGGQIGPDLTAYKRDDVRGMLMNVVNPSLEIREGFENHLVMTADGRTMNGFVTDQDNRVVVLKQADGQSIVIPRDNIEDINVIRRSIMPEGLLKDYKPQQVRDLFAYLRATQPLPE
jgi:putative membrane-bound dehydrogenase-like protein